MRRMTILSRRNRYILFSSVIGLLLIGAVLAAVLYFNVGAILNSNWARTKIMAALSDAIGGKTTYSKIEMDLSPIPLVVFRGVSIQHPDAMIRIKAVSANPEIFSLLKGELQIKQIQFSQPEVEVTLSKEESGFNPEKIEKKLIPVFQAIRKIAPDLRMEVKSGFLKMINFSKTPRTREGLAEFRNIDLQLSLSKTLEGRIDCGDSPWGPLDVSGRLAYGAGMLDAENIKGNIGRNSVHDLSGRLAWLPSGSGVQIRLKTGATSLIVDDLESWTDNWLAHTILHLKKVEGTVVLSSAAIEGPLKHPEKWRYATEGNLKHITFESDPGTAPISVATAMFKGDQNGLSFQKVEMAVLDSTLQFTGQWHIRERVIDNLSFSGSVGRKTIEWLSKYLSILKGTVLPGNIVLAGNLMVGPGIFQVTHLDISTGRSSITKLSVKLDWTGKPYLRMDADRGVIVREEFGLWGAGLLKQAIPALTSISGIFKWTSFHVEGLIENPATWQYQSAGSVDNVTVGIDVLPAPIHVTSAEFDVNKDQAMLRRATADFMDTKIAGSAVFKFKGNEVEAYDVLFGGVIGEKFVQWLTGLFKIPDRFVIPKSLTAANGRFTWKTSDDFGVSGTYNAPQTGTQLSLDLKRTATALQVRNGSIKDALSNAAFSLNYVDKKFVEFSLSGTLHKKTVNALYRLDQPEDAAIIGKVSSRIPLKEPGRATVTGALQAKNVRVPLNEGKETLMIHDIMISADKRDVKVDESHLSWRNHSFSLRGTAKTSEPKMIVDADIKTEYAVFKELFAASPLSKQNTDKEIFGWIARLPVEGTVRVNADRFVFYETVFTPLQAEVSLSPKRIRIFVNKALYCSLPAAGTVEMQPGGLSLTLRSVASGLKAAPILKCLTGERAGITGNIDYRVEVEGDQNMPASLKGDGEITVRNGRIYRFPLLSRILEFINVTQIFTGHIPDFGKTGMKYNAIRIRYQIEGEKIILNFIQLDGETLRIAGEGTINVTQKTMNLTLLVSPLRTIDKILGKIPVIKNFRNIVAIPVSVSGEIGNPLVIPLSPSAIGSHIYDLMKGVLRLPFKLFESWK